LRGRPIPLEGVHLRRREERIAAVLRERFGSETELGIFYKIYFNGIFCRVADPGCFYPLIPDLEYQIPDPSLATKEEEGETKFYPIFFS